MKNKLSGVEGAPIHDQIKNNKTPETKESVEKRKEITQLTFSMSKGDLYSSKIENPDAEAELWPAPFKIEKEVRQACVKELEKMGEQRASEMMSDCDGVYFVFPMDVKSGGEIIRHDLIVEKGHRVKEVYDGYRPIWEDLAFQIYQLSGNPASFEQVKPAFLVFVFEDKNEIRTKTELITLTYYHHANEGHFPSKTGYSMYSDKYPEKPMVKKDYEK